MVKVMKVLSVTGILAAVFICHPYDAYADRHADRSDHGYPHSRAYPYGGFSFKIPHGSISIGFGKERYYYHGGSFYRPYRHQYVVVPPPAGAVVYSIPLNYHEVTIDGVRYYVYNGTYYSRVPQGFQVVQPPAPVILEPATVVMNSTLDEEVTFTVNIPLSKGGYKAVMITRDGEGFQGPQGEFYREFPKVQQLKVMYGDAPKA